MNIFELMMLAVGLSADAFAASLCRGLTAERLKVGQCLTVGLWFGGFQALMPLCGFLLSSVFSGYIMTFGKICSFVILLFIGINMVREGFSAEKSVKGGITPREMIPLAFATSVDAFAAGVTLSFYGANILLSCLLIGAVTFILSGFGVLIGNLLGKDYGNKAEAAGGGLLILLALKLFLQNVVQN